MKIIWFMSAICAAALLGGCGSYQGGSADQYNVSAGMAYETEPSAPDPALSPEPPPNPDPGIASP